MAATSNIEWCDATFNPWIGCKQVSPACAHCYAMESSPTRTREKKLALPLWGDASESHRSLTSKDYWKQPLAWDARARRTGKRLKVFCASLADVFEENETQLVDHNGKLLYAELSSDGEFDITTSETLIKARLMHARFNLFRLIEKTPHLDWLLLTKRPHNITLMMREVDAYYVGNIWLGTTVESQVYADKRLPSLLMAPAKLHFVSCEPLVDKVDLSDYLAVSKDGAPTIKWIITGGESGKHARPANPNWFRFLRDQARHAKVPFFFKQWGEWVPVKFKEAHADLEEVDYGGVIYKGDTLAWAHDHTQLRVGKAKAGSALDGCRWGKMP